MATILSFEDQRKDIPEEGKVGQRGLPRSGDQVSTAGCCVRKTETIKKNPQLNKCYCSKIAIEQLNNKKSVFNNCQQQFIW